MKTSWKVFWDLQCPCSKVNWTNLPAIKERFGNEYDISIHLTTLAFHPQAFTAQCGASLIETKKGRDAALKYVDTCFENQESFMNAALGDARKSEIEAVFASIAEKAGVLDAEFTKESFLADLHDWEKAVKPAYAEHKIALGYGVSGTPKQVINEKIVPDTESAWGPDEWAEKLKTL
jgi:predicted DsbA family dithiol-disulfide isomerase